MKRSGEYGQATAYDELQAGNYVPVFMKNIEVEEGAEIVRGELLAESGGKYKAATSSDSGKNLAIAAADFTSSDETITQAYISGYFHREKIKAAEGVIESLELELRRQNIQLTKGHASFD